MKKFRLIYEDLKITWNQIW